MSVCSHLADEFLKLLAVQFTVLSESISNQLTLACTLLTYILKKVVVR